MKRWAMAAVLFTVVTLSISPAFAEEGYSSAGAEQAHSSDDTGKKTPLNNHTKNWETLWHHTLWDIGIIGAIFLAISIYFLFAYRRKQDDEEGDMPKMSLGTSLAWALIPAFIFMADDFYLAANGWKLWNDQRQVPEGAMEVKIVASMYNWSITYENGKNIDVYPDSDDDFVVPVGTPVVVRHTSEDVIHSFSVPDYRVKEDAMPGRVTYSWFFPEEVGEKVFTCYEYCGVGHSEMYGKLKIVSESEFEKWLAGEVSSDALYVGGE